MAVIEKKAASACTQYMIDDAEAIDGDGELSLVLALALVGWRDQSGPAADWPEETNARRREPMINTMV